MLCADLLRSIRQMTLAEGYPPKWKILLFAEGKQGHDRPFISFSRFPGLRSRRWNAKGLVKRLEAKPQRFASGLKPQTYCLRGAITKQHVVRPRCPGLRQDAARF